MALLDDGARARAGPVAKTPQTRPCARIESSIAPDQPQTLLSPVCSHHDCLGSVGHRFDPRRPRSDPIRSDLQANARMCATELWMGKLTSVSDVVIQRLILKTSLQPTLVAKEPCISLTSHVPPPI